MMSSKKFFFRSTSNHAPITEYILGTDVDRISRRAASFFGRRSDAKFGPSTPTKLCKLEPAHCDSNFSWISTLPHHLKSGRRLFAPDTRHDSSAVTFFSLGYSGITRLQNSTKAPCPATALTQPKLLQNVDSIARGSPPLQLPLMRGTFLAPWCSPVRLRLKSLAPVRSIFSKITRIQVPRRVSHCAYPKKFLQKYDSIARGSPRLYLVRL
ncbi:hypothetical protein R3P38DRAFT_2979222 [Favolaschia claudopus]|uniref:Uncharacterized protein n=1 Tax=Favolaschia claudopus TaxID=2862362 RepID=A0AAW0AZ50_9AGAR